MEGEPVLDAALRAGLDLPHSCRAGMCSTCRARVTEGSVRMDVNYGLEPWENRGRLRADLPGRALPAPGRGERWITTRSERTVRKTSLTPVWQESDHPPLQPGGHGHVGRSRTSGPRLVRHRHLRHHPRPPATPGHDRGPRPPHRGRRRPATSRAATARSSRRSSSRDSGKQPARTPCRSGPTPRTSTPPAFRKLVVGPGLTAEGAASLQAMARTLADPSDPAALAEAGPQLASALMTAGRGNATYGLSYAQGMALYADAKGLVPDNPARRQPAIAPIVGAAAGTATVLGSAAPLALPEIPVIVSGATLAQAFGNRRCRRWHAHLLVLAVTPGRRHDGRPARPRPGSNRPHPRAAPNPRPRPTPALSPSPAREASHTSQPFVSTAIPRHTQRRCRTSNQGARQIHRKYPWSRLWRVRR